MIRDRRTLASALLWLALLWAPAAAPAQAVTTEELRNALRQRDATIAALERRIDTLEAALRPADPAPTAPPSVAAATAPAATDEEASLAALSRGLVSRGALLLPSGALEVAPSVSYGFSQEQGLVLVDTPNGISTVSDQRRRDDSLEGVVSARLGLPWRSQLQLRVPFEWKHDAASLGDGTKIANERANVGDVEVELSHQLLAESVGWPAVIGAVSWRFPTGDDLNRASVARLASGSGAHQVGARLTLLKTVDPLVLFSTLSYDRPLALDEPFAHLRPGAAIGWQVGGLLAVSPDTSLNAGFAQQFRLETKVDGEPLKGSDGVAASLAFGIDQTLGARTLLDLSLAIGVTKDAPDYRVIVALPIRL